MMFLRNMVVLGVVCAVLPGVARAQAPATSAGSGTAGARISAQAGTQTATQTAARPAATSTRVHGTITDPDGELVPGATITLTPSHGAGIVVKSGSDGTYSVTVTPGTYSYVVTMPGFATYSALNVRIPAVASTTLDAKLQIGTQSQVVNVEANAIQLSVDPSSNQSSTILQGKDLEALSDDPDELESELQALAGPSAGPNGGQIYVDGFTGGQLPPKSSIREIRINQNPFSAEYDQLGYGRIEIFTKPGTDKLHGNFQVNGDPSQFNTGDPLITTYQPPYHTLFMFGNLTGPLSKNASYNLGGSYRQIQEDEVINASVVQSPSNPGTPCPPGSPDPTCAVTQFQQQVYYPQVRGDISPRLDIALGQNNVLTMRYHFLKNNATNAGIGNLNLASTGNDTSTTANIIQLSDTQTFSARLINETRGEYDREHVATTALSTAPSVSVSGDFNSGGAGVASQTDHQDHYEIQNYTSLQLKKNFLRFGGRMRATREAEDTVANPNGSFLYASNPLYESNTPFQFSITQVNNHKIGDTYADLEVYLETDWKARQNLTISYGARYELQNHLSDHKDIAPRMSFNYGLFSGHGAPKTVLRGGFGLFYTRFSQGNILTTVAENGTNENIYTKAFTAEDPAPASCAPSSGTALQTLVNACGATAVNQTTYEAASNLLAPYIVQFAIGADQQVSRAGTISVNYLHSQGVHQFATQNIGYNFTNPLLSTAHYQYFSEGVFNQNQLIVNGRVQTSRRISLFGYFSMNSAHGDTSGAGSDITVPGNIKADYGRTTFDVRNRLFLAGSISLPSFIQLSPFMIAQSGNPYNVTLGTDQFSDTFSNARPMAGPSNGVPAGTSGTNTIAGCGSFVAPPATDNTPNSYTPVPINDCTGPSLFTFNLRITKTFGFGETTASNGNGNGRGGQGGGPGGPGGFGGPPGGGHGGRGGGPGGGGRGGTNTGRRYNLGFGVQLQNLFNNRDLGTPQGELTSHTFGQSTQIAGGPYTTSNALRRISVQASFNF